MAKKIIKFALCVIGIVSIAYGLYYYFFKKDDLTCSDGLRDREDIPDEDSMDYSDALDLSSLKFSRHYVDLR